jgi:hypothetical protein
VASDSNQSEMVIKVGSLFDWQHQLLILPVLALLFCTLIFIIDFTIISVSKAEVTDAVVTGL